MIGVLHDPTAAQGWFEYVVRSTPRELVRRSTLVPLYALRNPKHWHQLLT